MTKRPSCSTLGAILDNIARARRGKPIATETLGKQVTGQAEAWLDNCLALASPHTLTRYHPLQAAAAEKLRKRDNPTRKPLILQWRGIPSYGTGRRFNPCSAHQPSASFTATAGKPAAALACEAAAALRAQRAPA
jgi:hypothetical protein